MDLFSAANMNFYFQELLQRSEGQCTAQLAAPLTNGEADDSFAVGGEADDTTYVQP